TFDTDPFEPQPDGVGTIFPFWVANRKCEVKSAKCEHRNSDSPLAPRPSPLGNGYVELPYTVPQDSTIFLLLRERHPDIWLQKLDWIARHGGMALLPVHPDYLCFDGATPNRMEYPSTYYRALLKYVSQRYEGAFWNTTPRKAAQFFADAMKVPAGSEA